MQQLPDQLGGKCCHRNNGCCWKQPGTGGGIGGSTQQQGTGASSVAGTGGVGTGAVGVQGSSGASLEGRICKYNRTAGTGTNGAATTATATTAGTSDTASTTTTVSDTLKLLENRWCG